jgi:hypothetical protein
MAWSLFRRGGSSKAVEAHLKRILFLMEFLQRHANRDKASVVRALREGLLLNIPTDMRDPEGRAFADPQDASLSIGFVCNDPARVHQFIIHGYEDIAGALVVGTAPDPDTQSVVWSISRIRTVDAQPPTTAELERLFWGAPGWQLTDISLGAHRVRHLSKD